MMLFRSCLVMCAVLTSFSVASVHAADSAKSAAKADDAGMQLQLIRNATLKIQYGDTVFLLDPMLAAQGTYPGFAGTHRSELRNPLVELPMPVEDVVTGVDAFIPDVVVLNAGAAEVNGFENDPIIMGREDTLRAYQYAPQAQIVAVHMDAINHMTLSRAELAAYIAEQGIEDRVLIPADGETLNF